jgi:5-formyltetrahydrofolate cyclo-ligase
MIAPQDITAWRKQERARLVAARLALSEAERGRIDGAIRARLAALLDELPGAVIGLYWPSRGEVDLRPLAEACLARDRDIALPAIIARAAPLDYRRWHPGAAMEPGPYDIPAPATPEAVRPDIILAPLVGFDDANYRLGYGGGYFDRTLAAAIPRPLAIGVGLEAARLASLFPQAHDIPLDFVVTETRLRRRPE